MRFGFGMGLPARRGGATGLGTITVDSDSLTFPDGNATATNAGAPAYLADATIWAPVGNRIFTPGTNAAFMVMCEVPWGKVSITTSQFMGIVGNSGTGGLAQSLLITAKRGLNEQDQRAISFTLRDDLNVALTGDVNVSSTQVRLLCVMRMDGSQVRFEVYCDGTLVGSVAPAMSTFAAMRLRSFLCYGANGSGSTNNFASSGSWFGFQGSISHVGYYDGTVSQTNCQNISNGADPLTELTAASWRMYRRLVGTDAASLAKPAAATGDATASMTVQNTRTLAFRRGSSLVPARSGANWFFGNHIRDGRVFGRLNGDSTARIYLSGTASGLTGGVEARVFDAATGQLRLDWTTVVGGTISAGVWAGYVDSPLNSGWGHIDVRPASTPSLVHRYRVRTGAGYVIGAMGQSQVYRCWQYSAVGTGVTGSGAVSTMHVTQRAATTYGLLMHPITDERRLADALAYAASNITQFTSAPVMVLNLANPGQGVADLLDDSNTNWNWSELEASIDFAIGPLAERRFSGVAINWLTNFASDAQQTGGVANNHLQPLFVGTRGSPNAGGTWAINHYLTDNLTFPASTRYWLSLPSRNVPSTTGPFDNSDNNGLESSPLNHGIGRQQWRDYAATVPTIIRGSGPWTDDLDMRTLGGNGAGGPHQNTTTLEGNNRMLWRVVEGGLRAAGAVTRTDPTLGTATINGGRTVITVPANLPNGGTLQTAWVLKGVSVPGGATTVQGFEVQDGGAGNWTRSGFTAEISGSSVLLTKSTGAWAAGTKIRYNANGPISYGTTVEDTRVYFGALYESGADEGGLGLPVAGLYAATLA